jgi:hypothetical protein
MTNDNEAGTCFHLAQFDAEATAGGRYAGAVKSSVTVSFPIPIYTRQPGDSPANQSMMLPPEPPLGWSVEGQPPTNGIWEHQRNLTLSATAALGFAGSSWSI